MCQLVLNSVSTHDLDDLATSWITSVLKVWDPCVCVCVYVCVCVCDFSRFLVEVTDLLKAGFELTTCRFGSVRVSRRGIGTAL